MLELDFPFVFSCRFSVGHFHRHLVGEWLLRTKLRSSASTVSCVGLVHPKQNSVKYVSICFNSRNPRNVMKCYEMFAKVVILDRGIQLIRLILPKLQAQTLKLVEQRRPACESNCSSILCSAKLGGSRRWHSKNLHFTAWSTDFLRRSCVTACCYGMQEAILMEW